MTARDIVLLGSTGSIGTQALDLVRANPDRFRVVGLTAGGSHPDLFEAQVAELVVITRPIEKLGWASACSGVTSASSAALRPRNGPPDAVSTRRRTSPWEPARRHCASAECSESTGTI